MGLMILAGAGGSVVLLALLFGAMALTAWEANEHDLSFKITAWWVLLVALVHVPGYLALRLWLTTRERRNR